MKNLKLTNTKILWVLLVALVVVALGWKACHAAQPKSLAERIANSVMLTAGFRWDKDCPTCPTIPCESVVQTNGNHDPAFVGAMLHYPISPGLALGGNFDRDWVDAPDWNARVYVAFKPW